MLLLLLCIFVGRTTISNFFVIWNQDSRLKGFWDRNSVFWKWDTLKICVKFSILQHWDSRYLSKALLQDLLTIIYENYSRYIFASMKRRVPLHFSISSANFHCSVRINLLAAPMQLQWRPQEPHCIAEGGACKITKFSLWFTGLCAILLNIKLAASVGFWCIFAEKFEADRWTNTLFIQRWYMSMPRYFITLLFIVLHYILPSSHI